MKAKKIVIILGILVIGLIVWNFKSVIHIFNGGTDIIVCAPSAFHFHDATDFHDRGIVVDTGSAYYDERKKIYYVEVPARYLDSDDVRVYVTGSLFNCFHTPTVKVNGVTQNNVSLTNTSNEYLGDYKLYHFYYDNTINSNEEYTFYVRSHNDSVSVKVTFIPE